MSNRASAGRYAKALIDVAIKESNPDHVEKDLAGFAGLFDSNPELRTALTHPAVPVQAKRAVLEQLIARAKPAPPVAKILLLLADRDRLELLPDLMTSYSERLLEHKQIVRAEVVTAVPLAEERARQLQQKLAGVTGRTVNVTARVDPDIVGGLVAKIGSTVYDASVATQLSKLRQRLVEQS
jgi:F-type H+-transporting ATPase subunit delta